MTTLPALILRRYFGCRRPVCPRCGVMGCRITKLAGKSTRPGVYKCKDCRKPFSVTVGTVMERSHVSLSKWVFASQLMASSKKSFSAHELHRLIDTTYETAWFLFHRLREAMNNPAAGPLGGTNEVVEMDEPTSAARRRTSTPSKAEARGRGPVRKMPVVSLVCRDGDVRSYYVANATAKSLRPILAKHMSKDAVLMTDDSAVYAPIGKDFASNATVNHSAGEYTRAGGLQHKNTVESHFALLKRNVIGTFHNISKAHLGRYLVEFGFRANTRHLTDSERWSATLTSAKGERLMYRQPASAPIE